jgi:hypothetical protein
MTGIQTGARVLLTEPNTIYRKYKEAAHMALLANAISQPSLDLSPIWIPVISEEIQVGHRVSS